MLKDEVRPVLLGLPSGVEVQDLKANPDGISFPKTPMKHQKNKERGFQTVSRRLARGSLAIRLPYKLRLSIGNGKSARKVTIHTQLSRQLAILRVCPHQFRSCVSFLQFLQLAHSGSQGFSHL